MIGGTLPLLGSGHRVGHGDTIILESCEYCNSFLSFFPTVAVILNIEADHLDFFKDLDDVEHSFRAFADRVPESGIIVANADDANTMHTLEGEERPVLTFGLEAGRCPRRQPHLEPGPAHLRRGVPGGCFAHVALRVPGEHNVKNALAAAAAAIALAVPARGGGGGPGRLPGGGPPLRAQGHLPRGGGLRRLRPPPRRAPRPAGRRPHPGLRAGHLRLPAPHLYPHRTPCSTTLWRCCTRPT